MTALTLIMVMNRWPDTLHDALAALNPYVCSKVAMVDQSSGFSHLSEEQTRHFDAVRYTQHRTLDRLRNESLALAREAAGHAWALVVDSDEFVEARSMVTMCGAIATVSDVSAFLLPHHSYVGYGRWTTSYGFRLFRLDRPIEYSYEIHETISPSLLRNGLRWEYLDAGIQHLDFINPVSGKRARYKALLEEALKKGDDLAFLKSLYALECFWNGDRHSAIRHLDEALALVGDRSRHSRLEGKEDFPLMLRAQLSLQLGDLHSAEILFERLYGTGAIRAAAEGALGLAWIASVKGAHEKALEWIEASLARWESAQAIFSRAVALCDLNKPHAALQDLSHGLSLNPMAGDPRILGAPHQESIFRWQSMLHPGYRGLPALLQKVTEKISE
jgi:tetratricopeptide (TPR) repeat protein